MKTKATLKVVTTRIKRVLIYSKIVNATISSLPGTLVENFSFFFFFFFFSKEQDFVATYQQQLSQLSITVYTLNSPLKCCLNP